jgi:hypothetical protein
MIRVFKVHETFKLLWLYDWMFTCSFWFVWQNNHVHVKDKGGNLNTLTNVLTNIISYFPLLLAKPYAARCYGHVMSKCCQYAINDLKMFARMKEVSIKDA